MGKTYVAMAVMASTLLVGRARATGHPVEPVCCARNGNRKSAVSAIRICFPARRRHRSLRPLVVRDYWDLLSNLHDHANAPLDRVHEATLRCVLLSLRTFAVRKQWITNRHSPWTAVEVAVDGSSGDAFQVRLFRAGLGGIPGDEERSGERRD